MEAPRILVVDDDKNIRLLLTQCLEETGYTVVPAVDGEHALKKADEEQFDLVMLDMKLPGMDGLQVLKKLRQQSATRPVVMITAHGTIETAVEAMKSGATDYLQKPFTPVEIRAIVQHNLKKTTSVQSGQSDFVACVNEARKYLANGLADNALPFLREAINLCPEEPQPYNLLGVADELAKDLDAARRMYRVALALDPSYQPSIVNLDRVSQWRYELAGVDLGEPLEAPEQKG